MSSSGGLDVLAKPLANGDVSVALFNETPVAATISTTAAAVGMPGSSSGYDPQQSLVAREDVHLGRDLRHRARARDRDVPGAAGSGSSTGTTHSWRAPPPTAAWTRPTTRPPPAPRSRSGTCNGGANQHVTLTAAGELRLYSEHPVPRRHGGANTAGTKAELWTCNGGANQQWRLNPDGTVTGVQSGLCLDVTGGDQPAGNVNGTQLELWGCNGGANQQWRLA